MNDRTGGDRKQNRQGYFFTLLSMPLYRTEKLLFPIQVIRSFSDRIFTGFG